MSLPVSGLTGVQKNSGLDRATIVTITRLCSLHDNHISDINFRIILVKSFLLENSSLTYLCNLNTFSFYSNKKESDCCNCTCFKERFAFDPSTLHRFFDI